MILLNTVDPQTLVRAIATSCKSWQYSEDGPTQSQAIALHVRRRAGSHEARHLFVRASRQSPPVVVVVRIAMII